MIHTLGLIARSYVSGHAPWSDAYESMIYVAWATVGIGLAFGRKSNEIAQIVVKPQVSELDNQKVIDRLETL